MEMDEIHCLPTCQLGIDHHLSQESFSKFNRVCLYSIWSLLLDEENLEFCFMSLRCLPNVTKKRLVEYRF